MGSVWVNVFVLFVIGPVLAKSRDCSDEALNSMKNCDECIRCGGFWCMDSTVNIRCTRTPTDSWCVRRFDLNGDTTSVPADEQDIFDFRHQQRFVKVLSPDQAQFTILGDKPEKAKKSPVELIFVNSTVKGISSLNPNRIKVTPQIATKQGELVITVTGTPQTDFCPDVRPSNLQEAMTLKLKLPGSENHATLTYQVPCACDYVDVNSEECNKRGNYSRGVCSCQRGWTGEACEKKESHCERGDIGFCRNLFTDELCSGNGICNCQGTCDCDISKPGSQYFDHICTDICMSTGYHDSCLLNPPIEGPCDDWQTIHVDHLNRSLLDDTDDMGRKVWVECEEKADICSVKYVAMNDGRGTTHIMILEPCNAVGVAIVAGGVNVTVPVILGVIALVAAASAVAGYMVWKNRTPPLPLNDPGYTNIDAEDCTGENPLYKPPTSNFKNPTYGKW